MIPREVVALARRYGRHAEHLPGGHIALRRDGASQVVVPATPSDHRWMANAERDLRGSDRQAQEAVRNAKLAEAREHERRQRAARALRLTPRGEADRIRAIARAPVERPRTPAIWLRPMTRQIGAALARAAAGGGGGEVRSSRGHIIRGADDDLPDGAILARARRAFGIEPKHERHYRTLPSAANESDMKAVRDIAGTALIAMLGAKLNLMRGKRVTVTLTANRNGPILGFDMSGGAVGVLVPFKAAPADTVADMAIPPEMIESGCFLAALSVESEEIGIILGIPAREVRKMMGAWADWNLFKRRKPLNLPQILNQEGHGGAAIKMLGITGKDE